MIYTTGGSKNKAKKVETSSYMIDWYELPPKTGLCIGLIISISRCPAKLTAGKILELSMYNFGGVRFLNECIF